MNILKPHVSLNVTNLEASVAFYEKLFDVPASKRRPGYAKFDLAAPSLNLSMVEAPRSGVNASHFGIQVATTEDVLGGSGPFQTRRACHPRRGRHRLLLRRPGQGLGRRPRRKHVGGVCRQGR